MNFPAGTILDHGGQPIVMSEASHEYEGATTGDRLGTWGLSALGPSTSGQGNIVTIRSRSRDAERNNPVVKGYLDSIVSNLVGTSITPTWNIENTEQRDELQDVWEQSQLEADYYGITDFYGTIEVEARSMIRDGEGLARIHDADPSLDLLVPVQTQILEADHLDVAHNDISDEGNEIRYGIEWKHGRRYKYWLYSDHPGESFLTRAGLNKIPVNASEICHIFRPTRAGQSRGIGWLAPLLLLLREIELYDDAELRRKNVAARWAGFIYSDQPVTTRAVSPNGQQRTVDSVPHIALKENTFTVLGNGKKVAFSETPDVGNNHKDYIRIQMRKVARAGGITYEQLTGDLEGVNYTSLRAGLIEIRRLLKTIIARTLIFQYCRPYVNRWIRAGVLNGTFQTISPSEYLKTPRLFHRVDWNPDGWDFTDPVKDRNAELSDIRNGIVTRGDIIQKRGGASARKVDQRQAAEIAAAEADGLKYDCYPNHDKGRTHITGNAENAAEVVEEINK